jgi:propionate CoA-transferase
LEVNMSKFMTAEEAVSLIKDNDTLCTEGFMLNAFPHTLVNALEERFIKTSSPRNLTLVHSAGQGDTKEAALNHLGHEGLLKRVVAGHWNLQRKIVKLATDEKIEAYNLPQGVICQLYRDIAAGKIGTITHVGLKTFIDPRQDGGRINASAKEDLVQLININGKELLLYKAFPLNCCLLRGSYADEKGNITMEKEAVPLGVTPIAQAVKNSGGKVIVQVSKVVANGTLDPKLVKIPHIYVDAIVVVPLPEHAWEAPADMIEVYANNVRIPLSSIPAVPLDERKIIARRAAMELRPDIVVSLGVGVPEVIANVANEEGIGDYMTLTVEAGPVGGIPGGFPLFGTSINADCILDQATQFDFYDGGGLDIAFLGLAETDEQGNVNVSKMGDFVTGAGGFINQTQNAKKVVFCGTFTAKGLVINAGVGKLEIISEGSVKKFHKKVGHITYSGEYAAETGQSALFITERAVFELRKDGMHLIEVAPGVDIDKDIFRHMAFQPIMAKPPKQMDPRIFTNTVMGIR